MIRFLIFLNIILIIIQILISYILIILPNIILLSILWLLFLYIIIFILVILNRLFQRLIQLIASFDDIFHLLLVVNHWILEISIVPLRIIEVF